MPLILAVATATGASTKHYSGIVHHSMPLFEFTIVEGDTLEDNESKQITSIEIRSAEKLVQTIQFDDEDDGPIDFAPGDPMTLEDVDCDGYKDLLVRNSVGVHGDTWYRLYRFDAARRQFVEYRPFKELAYAGVDCRTKLVKTYVNIGAAGCMYEAGWYQWVNQVLSPIRIESQDEDGSFDRTFRVWRDGKETTLPMQSIPADNCHAPSGTMVKQRK